jgi:Ni/Co efflux regulator RcnB
MTDERYRDRELSTAELADAADRAAQDRVDRRHPDLEDEVTDREVAVARGRDGSIDRADYAGTSLLADDIVQDLRTRWIDIQTAFVDEPRRAVEDADSLVAEAIKRLAESFANARKRLEQDWSRGADVSTEELRQALQRYRAFFGRLLEV